MAASRSHSAHDDRHLACDCLRRHPICLPGAREMSDFNRNPLIDWALRLYVLLAFAFIFAPIAASFVFSFNEDRFPSLPLGGFSMERSEEHTSELQSLMRISYAVFCLKKKK